MARYETVCTVGFNGPVSRNENRSAHGGVCHIQTRKSLKGLIARKVNTNGRHKEIGDSFEPTADQITHWELLGKAAR